MNMGSSAKRQAEDIMLRHTKHPRTAPGHQKAVGENLDRICHGCQKIDFDAIFKEDRKDKRLHKIWGGQWFDLSHIGPGRSCALCQFFYDTKEPPLDESTVDPIYRLRVFPLNGELGAWQLNIDDAPGFRVVPIRDRETGKRQKTSGIIMEHSNSLETFRGRQIKPQVDLSIIKEWLQFCDNHHKALCKPESEKRVPEGFCVIDCGTREIVPWKNVNRHEQYVALSYVWGTSNDEALAQDGTIPRTVPRTIEDTILLTTKLGYRYLWIDRYCIAQGNPVHKQKQIQSMNEIYYHSIITIVAAAGDDPYHGLPGIGVVEREPQPRVNVGGRSLIYTPYAKKEILQSKWNSRGWTYQEGLLSRRKLVVTATQVYFQCSAMHCLESIDASLQKLHIHKNIRMRDMVDISRVFPLRGLGKGPGDLEERLNEYLQRSLTTEMDILDAFKGVQVAFEQKFFDMQSLCGIPIYNPMFSTTSSEALVSGLLWWGEGSFKSDIEGSMPMRRKGFPSWTWAGWKVSKLHLTTFRMGTDMSPEARPVEISAEYADGLVLPWLANHELILARDESGSYPLILRIYGLTINVQIFPDGRWSGNDKSGVLRYIMTSIYNQERLKGFVYITNHPSDIPEDLESVFPDSFDGWTEQEVRIG
ncbi:HET-domain-containing protein [Pyrenochaeta sp. DS3sAY3a]|nr:HET-domain-containing protein [Pyrenochaeta sp. DS3sAY3a]